MIKLKKLTIWAFNDFGAQIFGPRACQVWTTLMYNVLEINASSNLLVISVPARRLLSPEGKQEVILRVAVQERLDEEQRMNSTARGTPSLGGRYAIHSSCRYSAF